MMETPHQSLTHAWIWAALDQLAANHNLSPSGLARLAGLDPTAFNRSKRVTGEGRLRWPSTESLAKVLDATGTSLNDFADMQISASQLHGNLVRSRVSRALNKHERRGDMPAPAPVEQVVDLAQSTASLGSRTKSKR